MKRAMAMLLLQTDQLLNMLAHKLRLVLVALATFAFRAGLVASLVELTACL